MRTDLKEVAPAISRLLSIAAEFSENNKYWSHLKNNEDFRFVHRIPATDRHKVEALYGVGRDMAIYMQDALASINYDFSKYPTVTSVVERFEGTWVHGNYDTKIPDIAAEICNRYAVELWSVNEMISLFKKQERLLAAVRVTLNMLKCSALYKMENGMAIMKEQSPNIHISAVTGSSININSDGSTARIHQVYNESRIFEELITAIKSQGIDPEIAKALIENVQMLAASHASGTFKDAYKNFIQNVSAHITVFTPFLPTLASLL